MTIQIAIVVVGVVKWVGRDRHVMYFGIYDVFTISVNYSSTWYVMESFRINRAYAEAYEKRKKAEELSRCEFIIIFKFLVYFLKI